MEDGLGPGVVAAVGELSQEEAGELSLQSLVVGGPAIFLLISGGWQRIWSQHTPIPPFSVKSLEVEMLERGIVCLVSRALALVCPGFPGCFPESRPWVLSLGAVVIRHSLHMMSSVGRAQPGYP